MLKIVKERKTVREYGNNERKKIRGHVLAMLCVIAWGTSFLVSKSLMAKLSPVQLMFLRFVIAWLAIWIMHPKWYFHWREEGRFILLSLLGNTLYYLAENTALRLTLASNVSILVSAAPLVSLVLLRLFDRNERLSGRQIAGVCIAFLGVLHVVFNGVLVLELNPLGDLLALAAAVCWALYGFAARRSVEKYDTFLLTRKLMFYGMLTTAPLVLAEGRLMAGIRMMDVRGVCGLLYLGVICSAVCYLMWNQAISEIGAMKANLYVYVVPVVTMIASVIFLDEKITLAGVIGVGLVVGGMLMTALPRRNRDSREGAGG